MSGVAAGADATVYQLRYVDPKGVNTKKGLWCLRDAGAFSGKAASTSCDAPPLTGNKARDLYDAIAKLGIRADHAAGGKSFYVFYAVTCVSYGDGRNVCALLAEK